MTSNILWVIPGVAVARVPTAVSPGAGQRSRAGSLARGRVTSGQPIGVRPSLRAQWYLDSETGRLEMRWEQCEPDASSGATATGAIAA